MATKLLTPRALRSLPSSAAAAKRLHLQRSFITLPGATTEPQKIATSRVLPYKAASLYTIVADVDSYSSFLPYCQSSRVTKWSAPDVNGKRWPSQADLKVGWGGFEETFTSRLFCVPGEVVEALGGEAVTNLAKSALTHHSSTFDAPAIANNLFQSISTRWTIRPLQQSNSSFVVGGGLGSIDQTEVNLNIEFQFANPIYAALSKAVTPKIAGIMIESFEKRAQELLASSLEGEKHNGLDKISY
ncbi:hypothetical protein B7463_g1680, partial [Scytalidium lignicola]